MKELIEHIIVTEVLHPIETSRKSQLHVYHIHTYIHMYVHLSETAYNHQQLHVVQCWLIPFKTEMSCQLLCCS